MTGLPWLIVLLLATVVPTEPASAASSARLVTYNLNYGNPRLETDSGSDLLQLDIDHVMVDG